MATIPTLSDTDAYHTARQTEAWANLGLSSVAKNAAAKNAALQKAMDYIVDNYPIMESCEEDLQALIDSYVQTACMKLAPFYATTTDELSNSPEVVSEKLYDDGSGIEKVYAVDKNGYIPTERFVAIRAYLSPVLASTTSIKVIR